MRFGLGVPTATEGLMYPVPYASARDAVDMAVSAERLGFESVWGNDHVSTQGYVRADFDEPPRYYDPLGYLSYVAAVTTRIRLGTAVLLLPLRHPVMVAKQIATLDQLSGGRSVIAVGVGAYREEFEAMWPGRRVDRGMYLEESIESLGALFRDRRASYSGKWIRFKDVESFPKPMQDPFPILSGGNSPGTKRRAALYARGWLPACVTVDELREGFESIRASAEEVGRDLTGFEVAPCMAVSIDSTHERAVARFMKSQMRAHFQSLAASTFRGHTDDDLARNLIGTPDEICQRVAEYAGAGANTLSDLLFACDSVTETLEMMEDFSENVIAQFQVSGTSEGE